MGFTTEENHPDLTLKVICPDKDAFDILQGKIEDGIKEWQYKTSVG